MPRAQHPLTPASSTDLKGQDGSKQLASLQMSFELPPPAIINNPTAQTKSSPVTSESAPSPRESQPKPSYPLQASEAVKSRRRSAAAPRSAAGASAATKDSFALPPPPTRSRKIIQMKPRAQDEAGPRTAGGAGGGGKQAANTSSAAAAAPADSSAGTGSTAPNKKKQLSATSAAGRKMARKTAHSLIERRRRSKMNEEFATLKNMIPACTGEMHKLAILQASIEYVRYLEDCVAKLKAQREDESMPVDLAPPPTGTYDDDESHHQAGHGSSHGVYMTHSAVDSPEEDVEMCGGSELPSPTFTATPHMPPSNHSASISPALLAEDSRRRNGSYSSISTAAAAVSAPVSAPDGRHYSFASATTPSPAFGPQAYPNNGSLYSSRPGSTLTSPALQPLRDMDHEATAALLMLNSDRRGIINTNGASLDSAGNGSAASGRGMSVRDLLST